MVRRNSGARTLHRISAACRETIATTGWNRTDMTLLHRLPQARSFLMERCRMSNVVVRTKETI
jgi:hypothetical protein